MCRYELPQAFESYHLTDRQTDTTEIIYQPYKKRINCCDVERMRCSRDLVGSCTLKTGKATAKQERLPREEPRSLLTNFIT